MTKLIFSKAADIQPENLLKNKIFQRRDFAQFLSETLLGSSFRTNQTNQPSVIMQPRKRLKPVSLARSFLVTTLLLWKLKDRHVMK